ncbi:hypothetical protein C8J57DRAFT_1276195 [Mycena rebaudengoi]|nr:hypothetical protein C8J57DRAFT_1276195 [Mycena rebaudengoi]
MLQAQNGCALARPPDTPAPTPGFLILSLSLSSLCSAVSVHPVFRHLWLLFLSWHYNSSYGTSTNRPTPHTNTYLPQQRTWVADYASA